MDFLKAIKLFLIPTQWKLPAFWLHPYESKKLGRTPDVDPGSSIETLSTNRPSDIQYWRATAGYTLATFLRHAGYSPEAQQRYIAFFNCTVAPELGRKPRLSTPLGQWQSFMTDDGSPLEISWDWGFDCQQATIRYSIEPIGPEAGSSLDPLNEYASSRFLEKMRELLPEADWQWSEHFRKEFCVFAKSSESDSDEAHQSRFFAAFDLHGSIATMKTYYFPAFRAKQIDQPKIDVLASAIARLPDYASSDFSAFDLLRNYIARSPSGPGGSLDVEILAVDCVHPRQGRLKIYVRSRQTSLESVRTVVTLGGLLASSEMDQSLRELETLWRSMFSNNGIDLQGAATISDSQSLSTDSHRTAGILYNFEIRPGCPLPVPKVYIPVRHYTRSDGHVMQVLRKYIQRLRREDAASFAPYSEAMTELLYAESLLLDSASCIC